ncbi:MAG: DEAD/DEAH box helicase family protein [Solirubrobacterales bacterium]
MEKPLQVAPNRKHKRRKRRPRPGTLAHLLRQLDPHPGRRGRQFEEICRWYLSDCRADFRQVWLWAEWPERTGPDCGIDLVAERQTGGLIAVQAKAVAPDHAIRKREIDSFLSESGQERFEARLLIATTDRIGKYARRVIREQEKPVEFLGRSALGKESNAWPASPAKLKPPKVPSLGLRCHQRVALDAAADSFGDGERAQVVMACGSGKTLVGIKARERFEASRTLVVVPSLPLMKQTIAEWQRHSQKPFRRLAVCSDASVDQREDVIEGHPGELGIRVSTDPEVIARFLEGEGDSITFSTYQSSEQVAAACRGSAEFDLVIADEAHWAAGLRDSPHATLLDNDRLPAQKRLFLTATPRIIAEEQRLEAADHGKQIASMDNEALFGPVAHRLSFGEAIELGLLADYRVVVCVVNNAAQLDLVRRRGLVSIGDSHVTDAASLATQVVVLRAMQRFTLRRVLTFHSRVNRAADFARRLPGVAEWLEKDAPTGALFARHVEGKMPAAQRESVLNRLDHLQGDESALISNVRCLAEGVDVPSIDAVAIIDPKRSRSEIIQAVGRALRTNGEAGKIATVIVPAFVPQDQDATQALRSSAFEPVWEVLSALRDQDERFADEVDALRFELGESRHLEAPFKRLHLDVPAEVGPEFAAAFNARVAHEVGLTPQTQIRLGRAAPTKTVPAVSDRRVDRGLDHLGLEALQRFARRTGHSKVPKDHKEDRFGLGDWFQGTLEAIERDAWGKPGRYFSDFDQLESFVNTVRSIDLDDETFPNLISELDPMRSLIAFWDTVAAGRFPQELQERRSVSEEDFPEGQVWEAVDEVEGAFPEALGRMKYEGEWSYWNHGYTYLMEQMQPKSHQEKLDAAMVALSVLNEAERLSETVEPMRRADFRLGVVEGIEEVARAGCLIDQVEQRFRTNWDRIHAYVKGWDFGKTRRQGSGNQHSLLV